MKKLIKLTDIGYEKKYYPRVNGKTDWVHVDKLRNVFKVEKNRWPKDMPPLYVVRATGKKHPFVLTDGWHRGSAAHAQGIKIVPAQIENLPECRWFARSAELNAHVKRSLDNGDIAWIVQRLKADGIGMNEAEKILHIPKATLERITVSHVTPLTIELAEKIPEGRSNRKVNGKHVGFLKAVFADTAGTGTAIDALKVQGPIASHSVLNVLQQAIAVIKIGVDESNEDIREAIKELKRLLR